MGSVETSVRDSAELISRWHGVGRLLYAIIVRFTVTSSEAQLQAAGALFADNPSCLMHTHLSGSPGEIAFVKQQFPWSGDYTDVYERFGLLGPNAVFAHGVHLSERECHALYETGSMVVHCPTSNNFLDSGLFDINYWRAAKRLVNVGAATDVTGGTSYSMLQTLVEAYKVVMLGGCAFNAFDGFYLATLGNARGPGLFSEIGTLNPGTWVNIVSSTRPRTGAGSPR